MPFVKKELFQYILDKKEDNLAAIPQIGDFIEPTCGYYHKDILAIIESQIEKKKYKLKDMLEEANFKKIVITDLLPFYDTHIFHNINNPQDLEIATKRMLYYGE
jgi:molybdopterin-guanine dinucleotide biosynthesis protein A